MATATAGTPAPGGFSWSGCLALAALVYLVAVWLGVAPSPADVIRRIRGDMHFRRSGDPTPDVDVSDDDVVSDVGSVRVIPFHVVKGMVQQSAEAAEGNTGPDDPPPASRAERREWVALRLRPDDPLSLALTEIDRRGAELFGCSEKTIERDRFHLTGRSKRKARS